ncbi:type 1 glutamine amidotransferase domain-containing protein [Haematobacter genomosp. 1]|uniref:Protease n=1 Tax=Haematobacter genomosp. 1 TaxID=366618 RepID=A0A212AET2_9RHOB|nr:type 1 glutamine amidotransferase domain-containing protein [Haematobacter genomosp. 1]OWJ79958.1 protease [Haematobacter genomosp. 1]
MTDIRKARIAILATDGFEQSELEVPLKELRDRGAQVEVVTPEGKAIRGWKDGNWTDEIKADRELEEVTESDYDALVLPGGVINPDKLRTNRRAVDLVKAFVREGKVVAAICHGPWMLVEADAVRGRNVTSYKSIMTDMKNAGGHWADDAVVTDQGIITSRSPDDLEPFVAKIVEEVREGKHQRAA